MSRNRVCIMYGRDVCMFCVYGSGRWCGQTAVHAAITSPGYEFLFLHDCCGRILITVVLLR